MHGYVVDRFAEALETDSDSAREVLQDYVAALRQKLRKEGKLVIDGLGTFEETNGSISFDPTEDLSSSVNRPYQHLKPVSVEKARADIEESYMEPPETTAADPPGWQEGEEELPDDSAPTGKQLWEETRNEIDEAVEEPAHLDKSEAAENSGKNKLLESYEPPAAVGRSPYPPGSDAVDEEEPPVTEGSDAKVFDDEPEDLPEEEAVGVHESDIQIRETADQTIREEYPAADTPSDEEEVGRARTAEKIDQTRADQEVQKSGTDDAIVQARVEEDAVQTSVEESEGAVQAGGEADAPELSEQQSPESPRAGVVPAPSGRENNDAGGRNWIGWAAGFVLIFAFAAIASYVFYPSPEEEVTVLDETPAGDQVAPDPVPPFDPETDAAEEPTAYTEVGEPVTAEPAGHPVLDSQPIDIESGGYTWVLASVPSMSVAETIRSDYEGRGYKAGIVAGQVNGTTFYRVGLGQFESIDEAMNYRGDLPAFPADTPGDYWLLRIQ